MTTRRRREILATVLQELKDEVPNNLEPRGAVFGLYSAYTRLMGVSGPTLRDSYHLGQTLVNDYGRPYQSGFNNITGFSSVNGVWPFLVVRARRVPACTVRHWLLARAFGPALRRGRHCVHGLQRAAGQRSPGSDCGTESVPPAGGELILPACQPRDFAWPKSDAWLGPGFGGAMAWSNNAEDIYSFRVNRVEPLYIPYFSALLGPISLRLLLRKSEGTHIPKR